MHYLKRSTKLSIFFFLTIILTLTNYIQILTKTDIYFSAIKILREILKNKNEYLKK